MYERQEKDLFLNFLPIYKPSPSSARSDISLHSDKNFPRTMRHGGRKYNDQKHTTKQQQISKKNAFFRNMVAQNIMTQTPINHKNMMFQNIRFEKHDVNT